jgi:hypothetical protein
LLLYPGSHEGKRLPPLNARSGFQSILSDGIRPVFARQPKPPDGLDLLQVLYAEMLLDSYQSAAATKYVVVDLERSSVMIYAFQITMRGVFAIARFMVSHPTRVGGVICQDYSGEDQCLWFWVSRPRSYPQPPLLPLTLTRLMESKQQRRQSDIAEVASVSVRPMVSAHAVSWLLLARLNRASTSLGRPFPMCVNTLEVGQVDQVELEFATRFYAWHVDRRSPSFVAFLAFSHPLVEYEE